MSRRSYRKITAPQAALIHFQCDDLIEAAEAALIEGCQTGEITLAGHTYCTVEDGVRDCVYQVQYAKEIREAAARGLALPSVLKDIGTTQQAKRKLAERDVERESDDEAWRAELHAAAITDHTAISAAIAERQNSTVH
jgi:hypothetical protein